MKTQLTAILAILLLALLSLLAYSLLRGSAGAETVTVCSAPAPVRDRGFMVPETILSAPDSLVEIGSLIGAESAAPPPRRLSGTVKFLRLLRIVLNIVLDRLDHALAGPSPARR